MCCNLSLNYTENKWIAWWRYDIGTFSALPAICAGKPLANGGLNKQSINWWFQNIDVHVITASYGDKIAGIVNDIAIG